MRKEFLVICLKLNSPECGAKKLLLCVAMNKQFSFGFLGSTSKDLRHRRMLMLMFTRKFAQPMPPPNFSPMLTIRKNLHRTKLNLQRCSTLNGIQHWELFSFHSRQRTKTYRRIEKKRFLSFVPSSSSFPPQPCGLLHIAKWIINLPKMFPAANKCVRLASSGWKLIHISINPNGIS